MIMGVSLSLRKLVKMVWLVAISELSQLVLLGKAIWPCPLHTDTVMHTYMT